MERERKPRPDQRVLDSSNVLGPLLCREEGAKEEKKERRRIREKETSNEEEVLNVTRDSLMVPFFSFILVASSLSPPSLQVLDLVQLTGRDCNTCLEQIRNQRERELFSLFYCPLFCFLPLYFLRLSLYFFSIAKISSPLTFLQ